MSAAERLFGEWFEEQWGGGPGDFTPYDHADYVEEETSLLDRLGLLPEWLLELGADRRLAEHQTRTDLEAGG